MEQSDRRVQAHEGLFTLYYNETDQKLLMAIRHDQYNQEFILPISIARGAGMMYLGGDTLNFGEQWIISFRRAADRILVIRRNVKFRPTKARRRPIRSRCRTTTASSRRCRSRAKKGTATASWSTWPTCS